MSADKVKNLLGKPTSTEKQVWHYSSKQNFLNIYFDTGKVSEIEFDSRRFHTSTGISIASYQNQRWRPLFKYSEARGGAINFQKAELKTGGLSFFVVNPENNAGYPPAPSRYDTGVVYNTTSPKKGGIKVDNWEPLPSSAANIAPSPSGFTLPQENKECTSDYGEPYYGVTYGPVRLGVSFKCWKEMLDDLGYSGLIEKIPPSRNNITTANYILTRPAQDMWGNPWEPIYTFVDDKGVYRLALIMGSFGLDAQSDLITHITEKQGEPDTESEPGAFVWTKNDTRIMVSRNRDEIIVSMYQNDLFQKLKASAAH
ncbi:MAG: hypothetical protein K2Y22_04010 [Candidatus Obscuribacterales bacterium]|nr:hypothetical protein [Candidatus Obscuribacterales bacterium]